MRFLSHEDPETRALTYIPLVVRRRLDECGVRVSLAQWQQLPLVLRGAVALMATGTDAPDVFRAALTWMLSATVAPSAILDVRVVPTPWQDPEPPALLADALREAGINPDVWHTMDTDTRFGLLHALKHRERHPDDFLAILRTVYPERS